MPSLEMMEHHPVVIPPLGHTSVGHWVLHSQAHEGDMSWVTCGSQDSNPQMEAKAQGKLGGSVGYTSDS